MKNDSAGLSVTLSAELYDHFCSEARRLDVPLEWLIASLIVDTIDDHALPLSPA